MTIEIIVHDEDKDSFEIPRVVVVFPNENRFSLNENGDLKQWEEFPQDFFPGIKGRWKHLYGRMRERGGW